MPVRIWRLGGLNLGIDREPYSTRIDPYFPITAQIDHFDREKILNFLKIGRATSPNQLLCQPEIGTVTSCQNSPLAIPSQTAKSKQPRKVEININSAKISPPERGRSIGPI